jgi:acid phosphatase family membrane protein YuiD
MNINVSHHIQTRDGFDVNAAQRELKGQELMTLMRTQDLRMPEHQLKRLLGHNPIEDFQGMLLLSVTIRLWVRV